MIGDRPALLLAALACTASACGGGDAATAPTTSAAATTTPTVVDWPDEPVTEEAAFISGDFEVVGDLILPGGEGPYPAVIVVAGSGAQTRTSSPTYNTVREAFGDAGFAVLSWDKPGSGESTGEFTEGNGLRERAAILHDGLQFLATDPHIDPHRIGFWGVSQAGWVMPLALEAGANAAFMISVSGGAEDSIEQMAYQISEQLACNGVPREQAELAEQWGPQAAKGETYALYTEAMEVLLTVPGMDQFIGTEMATEDDWQPWPPEIDAYFDPITVLETTTIPVLAVFGELDKNIDPIQGADAYQRALTAAGNPDFHVEVIPGVGHTMLGQQTGCIGERGSAPSARYADLIREWADKLAGLPVG